MTRHFRTAASRPEERNFTSAIVSHDHRLSLEVERLAAAFGRSQAQLVVGTTNLLGNLLVQFNDVLVRPSLANAQPAARQNVGQDHGDSADLSSTPSCSVGSVYFESVAPAGGNGDWLSVNSLPNDSLFVALTGVVLDSASMLTRSVERFLRAFDQELGSLWSPVARRPGILGRGGSK
jgi:hypothetical protein